MARARASLSLMPRWMRSGSVICNPIVRIGLSEVIGSWKIIEMSRPRISRISSSVRSRRLRPSKVTRPFGMRPVSFGRRRMIESAETDLPDPDSPTMATTSPGSM